MSNLPLSERGAIANSVANFVLENPEYTNILEAYNAWVQKERYRDFPWGDADMVALCLELFDAYLHKLPRDMLEDIMYDEMCQLLQTE